MWCDARRGYAAGSSGAPMADYAEIRILAKGPTPETAELTIAITFTYSVQAVEAFKDLIPYQDRAWNADHKTWYAKPQYLEDIKVFTRMFDGGMLIDGNRWENLRTGQVSWQLTLFEDEREVGPTSS
jgi:hypothetical protein